MRALFSYGLAFAILLLAALWFATGTLVQGGQGPGKGERPIVSVIEGEDHGPLASQLENAGLLAQHEAPATDPTMTIAQRNASTQAEEKPQDVRTVVYTAQAMPIEVPLRGRTQAKSVVTAVAETAGTVETVHVSKGERVEAGELLCTLDQGTRAAAVSQAEAGLAQAQVALQQAQADVETNSSLRDRGLAPANTATQLQVALSGAQAQVRAAEAALDNAKAELARTEIKAKVDGLVQDPVATAGSMLAAGTPCATIIQLDPIVFAGMVPEAHIGLAKLGLDATIKTVTGQQVNGKVTYIASQADNATRAFPVEIEIPNDDFSIRDGVTAEAVVNIGTAPGHLLPQSVLTLNDDGVLGVRTVEDGKVAFHEVTIVSDTRNGVWVTGLPAIAQVITVGQENVTTGQAVNATAADAADAAKATEATAS
jgi:multidrug efflux system membrane fusion protein